MMNLQLRFHPAAKTPLKAWGYAVFIVAMGFLMWMIMKQPLVTGLLMAVMVYNVIPYFVPTNYTIDEQGIHYKRLQSQRLYKWEDYRSYSVEKNGLIVWAKELVPNAQMDTRERFKALRRSAFLPMSEDLVAQAEPVLRQRLIKLELPKNGH